MDTGRLKRFATEARTILMQGVKNRLQALGFDLKTGQAQELPQEMDGGAGVHLRYRLHTENLDSDQDFDVHGKEGVYYSLRTTHVGSLEGKTITFFQDGTAYNLDPDDMTGIIATTTSSEIVLNSPILMDSLWKLIWTRAQELAYTTEEREMEGKTYSVEVFPASEYQGEAAFYFDQDGTLRYCVEGATEISAALGELTYTIEEINDHVDESLFDISEYTIS